MESGNRSAGNCDKHNAPDRRTVRMHTGEVIPDFRDHKLGMCKDSNDNSYRHDDQADSEYRVNPSDDLINRNKCCDKIVCQNDPEPEFCTGKNSADSALLEQCHDQTCRSDCKHSSYHNQQNHTEYTHHIFHCISKVNTTNL